MACHPPDYLSMPSGDDGRPASWSLSNPLLRPLDESEFAVALLKFQEAASFLRGTHKSKMVGQVLGMCPAKEISQKLEMNTASDLERVCSSKVNPRLALKSFQRSDASKVFKSEETRPAVWCRRTIYNVLCYFVDADVVQKPYIMQKKFSYLDVYNFLRDRLRSIWQDLTVQHCTKHRAYIECFEISIRFLIYSNEVLCENEEYDIAQNTGLLNTCLDKLMQGYEDVQKYMAVNLPKTDVQQYRSNNPFFEDIMNILVYKSPHQAEFWSYRLLLHIPQLLLPGGSATFCDIRHSMPEELKGDPLVRFAIEVCHAAASGNLYRYITLMRQHDCPALNAAVMNRFAICLRVLFLEGLVVQKIAKKGVNPIDMDTFKRIFGFDSEPEYVIDALLKKYEITTSQGESKIYLDMDEAKADQLSYDSASLRKISNKFQTSSAIVRQKFEGYPSRQKIFDPDFEYPSGTGPHTTGPPYTEDLATDLLFTSSPQLSPSNISSDVSACNDLSNVTDGQGLRISPPLAFQGDSASDNSTPKSFVGNLEGSKGTKPLFFGTLPQQLDSKPMNFFSGGGVPAVPEIFAFGTTAEQCEPNVFRFDVNKISNSNPFDAQTKHTTEKEGQSPSISSASTTSIQNNTFIFGNIQQTSPDAPKQPSSGVLTTTGTDTKKASLLTTSGVTAEPNPLAFLQPKNDPQSQKPSNVFSKADASNKDTATTSLLGNKDDNKLFAIGTPPAANKPDSGSAPFSFGSSPITSQPETSAVTEIGAAKSLSNTPSNEGGFPNIFGNAKGTGMYDNNKVFFQTSTSEPQNVPPAAAIAPVSNVAVNTAGNPSPSTSMAGPTAPMRDASSKNEADDHTKQHCGIVETYERSKELKHVKLKKPKVSDACNTTETATVLTLPVTRDILRSMQRVGSFIVDKTSDSAYNIMGKSRLSKLRICGSMNTASDVLQRIKPAQVTESLGEGQRPTKRDIFKFSTERTPRDNKNCIHDNVVYLNKGGSEKHLLNMYVAQTSDNGMGCIIPVHVACERCQESNEEHVVRKLLGVVWLLRHPLQHLALSIARYTTYTTSMIADYIRRYFHHKKTCTVTDGKVTIAEDGTSKDQSIPYNEIVKYTGQTVVGIAETTGKGALATAHYLAKLYKTSRLLINRANDVYRTSIYGDASPLSCIISVTEVNLMTIIEASEIRLKNISLYSKDIDCCSTWGSGIFWRVNFFDPIIERSDLIKASSSSSETGKQLTTALIKGSINEYMNSDYCVRLKQDVLHMAGFDVDAEHLIPGHDTTKQHMVECYRGVFQHQYSETEDSILNVPMTIAASLNLCDDGTKHCPEVYLRPSLNNTKCDGIVDDKKRRKVSHGIGWRNVLVNNSGVTPMERVIDNTDFRYKNRVSIALYAFAQPVYIGEPDVLVRILASANGDSGTRLCFNVSGVDNYGIISTVVGIDRAGVARSYTTCVVCYRVALSKLDLLSVYEYMNPSVQGTISVCGCMERGRTIRKTRLSQVLQAIEKTLMDETLNHALQMNIQLDYDMLRRHIVFACVGFQLHVEASKVGSQTFKADLKKIDAQDLILVPRILYADGLAQAIQDAACRVVESHSIFLLQNSFQIPSLHGYLIDAAIVANSGITSASPNLGQLLKRALQSTIDRIEQMFSDYDWDVYYNIEINQVVESIDGSLSDEIFGYSRQSFIALLKRLQQAAENVLMPGTNCQGNEPDADRMWHLLHYVTCEVLSKVIVSEYRVPYAVGLYMTRIRELAMP